jgi:hypothetical protein
MKILQIKISGTQISFSTNFGGNWVSSCLSFFLSASSAARYIFTSPSCTTTIISLDPCALNIKFQHFILRFNKISLVRRYHPKTGYGVKAGPKTGRQGDFQDTGQTDSLCLIEVLLKQQHLFQVLFLYQIPYIHLNFIVLILWITRDQFFSWFLLKESTSCFMGVVVHTPTTRIPHILTWLFHMIPFKDCTKIQGRIGECNIFYSPISPCSQTLRALTMK